MHEFKLSRERLQKIRKRILLITIPVILVAVATGVVTGSASSSDKITSIAVFFIVTPLVSVFIGWGFYKVLNRQKEIFESYTLTITQSIVTREQLNAAPVSIYIGHIKEIVKNNKGSFMIKGNTPKNMIFIPSLIDNPSQLEEVLNKIVPVTLSSFKTII